jgi:hypothetical protein
MTVETFYSTRIALREVGVKDSDTVKPVEAGKMIIAVSLIDSVGGTARSQPLYQSKFMGLLSISVFLLNLYFLKVFINGSILKLFLSALSWQAASPSFRFSL